MTNTKHLHAVGRGIYVPPPPPDIEPIDAGDPFEGAGALAWGFGALVVALAFLLGFLLRGWL